MKKITTTTRYAEDYNGLHVEADVLKNEQNGEITSINGGIVRNEDFTFNAWFSISSDGQLNIGGVNASNKEEVSKVSNAILDFYKDILAL